MFISSIIFYYILTPRTLRPALFAKTEKTSFTIIEDELPSVYHENKGRPEKLVFDCEKKTTRNHF